MKILMVSSYLPYPLFSGGQVRLYNLIKELSSKHEITLICEKRPQQTFDDIKEVEKICKKVITVDRRKQWSLENIIKSAASVHSFLVTGHTNPEMKQLIMDELIRETFDLIHVETFYVMQNLPMSLLQRQESIQKNVDSHFRGDDRKDGLPIVLVEHNIEYQVYKRYVDRAPAPLRPFLALDVAKIKREEEKFWQKATKVVAVSNDDKKIIEQAGIHPAIVANGVNIDAFFFKQKSETKVKKLLFIGDFKWLQNRDALKFIIEDIWPKISLESTIKAQLWIVGRTIPDSIKALTDDPDVLFDEESSVKPTPEIFQEADILLAPIRVGGGTSYKILESMSSGTPVVTMSLSADAIGAKESEQIMVGNSAEELAAKTLQLLQNEKKYQKVAKGGRKLIEEKYSWQTIAKHLDQVYKEVA
ncbi:MAG TPA: glycosyltransferase family 4 protein [Methylomirabilota bacterium]|nr:glycosyltransferase family 4 protein [Methylomirabilota bacterium]